MADPTGSDEPSEDPGYELQVYATSPLAPTPRQLIAEAEGGGVPLALAESDAGEEDRGWSRLVIEAGEPSRPAVVITVPDALERQLAGFREDREAGEEVPEQLFDARRLYLVELAEGKADDGEDEDEVREAGFVLAAWALASLTEGLVFDPHEDFFADAESFFAMLMDEGAERAPEPAGS